MKKNLLTLGMAIFVFLFAGCEQEQPMKQVASEDLYLIYKDSVFLSIDGDLYDPLVIWEHVDTYLPAFYRFVRHTTLENNQVVWHAKSGKELNISQNIYEYLVGAYENMNVTAKEKGKVLVKRLDNVYVFAPEETKADDEGEALNLKNKIVLSKSDDVQNFVSLHWLFRMSFIGNLNKVIDFKKSGLRGNGAGDVSIYATLDIIKDFGPAQKSYWNTGYYCTNACAPNSLGDDCEFNEVVQHNRHGGQYTDYCSLNNSTQLPLITVRNGWVFASIYVDRGVAVWPK